MSKKLRPTRPFRSPHSVGRPKYLHVSSEFWFKHGFLHGNCQNNYASFYFSQFLALVKCPPPCPGKSRSWCSSWFRQRTDIRVLHFVTSPHGATLILRCAEALCLLDTISIVAVLLSPRKPVIHLRLSSTNGDQVRGCTWPYGSLLWRSRER